MKKIISIIVGITLTIGFSSCDEIKTPLKENQSTCGDENLPIPIKKILLEDYTGHDCPNCPDAAEKIHELQGIYCDHIIPVAVHTGFFARPITSTMPEDFRTEEGAEYQSTFSVTQYPTGMINRSIPSGSEIAPMNFSQWAEVIAEQLKSPIEINIILNNTYNPNTRNIKIQVIAEIYKDVPGELNLCLFFVEDSIIAPQKNHTVIVQDYVHRHMLRAVINGTWGEHLATDVQKEQIISKEYEFELDTAWNENHGEVIAFIFKTSDKEIIQAESEPVISD